MEQAERRFVRRRMVYSLDLCSDYFLVDGETNRYNSSEDLYFEDRLKAYIRGDVWEEWNRVVNTNIDDLKTSESFDELCEKLTALKIKGIGVETIIDTAAQLAYKYDDIIIDDSCWSAEYLQKASIIEFIKINCECDPKDFCEIHIQRFVELNDRAKVLTLIANADSIRKYILQGCH